jgi:hypothetical protein
MSIIDFAQGCRNLSNVFASGQAYVALSRVRTRNDLFIKNWSLRGLLNVKHAIRTRLTKESEDARTMEDDEIDKKQEGDGARPMVEFTQAESCHQDDTAETRAQGWEDFRKSAAKYRANQQDQSDWNSDDNHAPSSSSSSAGSSFSYTSVFESLSRIPGEFESSLSSESSEDDEVDRNPDSDDMVPSDDESSGAATAQSGESIIDKIVHGAEFDTFRSEKRRYYGTSGSDVSESDESTGGLEPNVVSTRQAAKGKSVLDRTKHSYRAKKRVRGGSSDDPNDSDGDREPDYGIVSVKRKACDEIEAHHMTKKMRGKDEESDDEDK